MLKLVDITKQYKSSDITVEALKGINLEFRKNEFVSVLGPSGCGKTTLLNIIGGLDKYTSGDLIINGTSTKAYKDHDWDAYRNYSIGFVFQSYNLIMHQTILSNVELALTLSGIGNEERKERAIKALNEVGLADHIHKKPNQLSGGQMQRVAIARAIVNDPDIILADEPTGALDTQTSVQIMEILKKISKDRLVIMVTHNPDLAQQYSTRIIRLLDGKVVEDSNPYTIQSSQPPKKKEKTKTSMSFWTALHLSINNLFTKKGRTLLTSFAGSIGIIGIALVLALSNGFNTYLNNVQSDTLSSYPVSIATGAIDFDKFDSMESIMSGSPETTDDGQYIIVYENNYDQYINYGHFNNLNANFVQTVKDFADSDSQKPEYRQNLNLVQFNYYTPLKFIYKAQDNSYKLQELRNNISIMSGKLANTFYQELDDEEFMLQQYDVVYTSPTYDANDKYGLTLVIDKGNRIRRSVINSIGYTPKSRADGTYENINFEDIAKIEYRLLYNDDYYTFDSSNNVTMLSGDDQTTLQSIYDETTRPTLKINRIIRPKDDSNISLLSSGVMFSKELAMEYRQNCINSEIATKQTALKATQTDKYTFYAPLKLSIDESRGLLPEMGFVNTDGINYILKQRFGITISLEDAYQMGVQQIGISTTPTNIFFYPKNFDGKKDIENMVAAYNKTVTTENQIIISNTAEILTQALGNIVNIISYVLIAFASISLIVSSIMIGVITYTSVIERTKEIGVLRSLGARKKDVSRVFNAETSILGAFSGIIGIAVTYILCVPICIIIEHLSGIGSIAILNPLHAIALIIISTLLSLIAGLLPSRYAARQDPVVALRSD